MPFADTRSTLETLCEHDLHVGVVSNIGFDIRTVFSHHGLADLVEAFALSFEHGIIKPDPALFEAATTALGVLPSETIMVGDNIADAGAVRAGMRVYLLPPVASTSPRRLGDPQAVCRSRYGPMSQFTRPDAISRSDPSTLAAISLASADSRRRVATALSSARLSSSRSSERTSASRAEPTTSTGSPSKSLP